MKEMFKHVPVARIKKILKCHDVHSTIEVLLGEEERQKSEDDDDLPTIDLTVSVS